MGKYVRYGRILLCLYISYCIHKQIIVSGIWTELKTLFPDCQQFPEKQNLNKWYERSPGVNNDAVYKASSYEPLQ